MSLVGKTMNSDRYLLSMFMVGIDIFTISLNLLYYKCILYIATVCSYTNHRWKMYFRLLVMQKNVLCRKCDHTRLGLSLTWKQSYVTHNSIKCSSSVTHYDYLVAGRLEMIWKVSNITALLCPDANKVYILLRLC